MHTKISNLSELSDILIEKNKLESGVLNFISRFKVGSLLRSFSALKEQGYSLIVIITNLILSPLRQPPLQKNNYQKWCFLNQ